MSKTPSLPDQLQKLLPPRWRAGVPLVPVIHLNGPIGMVGPFRPGLSIAAVGPALEKAFGMRGAKAVALVINSPGGSAVQSRLIFKRIRALAAEKKLPVYVFCEDVAASGGYMLALAGDEIYVDPCSIVGSIGVIAALLGFDKMIEKIGVDRRVYTAGKNKMMLDAFQPEKPEEVERFKAIQAEIHTIFKDMVRERRAGKLAEGQDEDLFSGAFWTGQKAIELGLVDAPGDIHTVLREKFGEKVLLRKIALGGSWFKRRLGLSIQPASMSPGAALSAESLMGAIEERALWGRYGL